LSQAFRKWESTALLFLIAIIWGAGFVFTQIAVRELVSLWLMLTLRFGIAAVCLLLFSWKRIFPITRQELKYGTVAGIFLFSGFYTQTIGIANTNLSNAGFLTAAYVIIVPLFSWILTKKKPPVRIVAAAVICLTGIYILNYRPGAGFLLSGGDWWVLGCAVFFACHVSYLGYCADKVDPLKLTFLQMLFVFLCSGVGMISFDLPLLPLADWKSGLIGVLYLGLLSTCLCIFLQTYVQRSAPPGKAAIIMSTESVWCAVFSVWWGYERASVPMVAGGLIIFGSVVLLEYRGKRKEKETQEIEAGVCRPK